MKARFPAPRNAGEMEAVIPVFNRRLQGLFEKNLDVAPRHQTEVGSWLVKASDFSLLNKATDHTAAQADYQLRVTRCRTGVMTISSLDIPIDNARLHLANHHHNHALATGAPHDDTHAVLYRPTPEVPRVDTLKICDYELPAGALFHFSASHDGEVILDMLLPEERNPQADELFRVDDPNESYLRGRLSSNLNNAAEADILQRDGPYALTFQRMATLLGTMSMLAGEDPRLPFGS